MRSRMFVGLIGAIVVLTGGLTRAANEGRIEPLDGAHNLATPPTERPETPQRLTPNDAGRPPAGTPFGAPLPPSQLTPAPVLPFHPNRSLTPSPGPPSSLSQPPNSARAETRAHPAPFSGGGRLGR
jgi:hypothetical protein